jgi:hypothetical protein
MRTGFNTDVQHEGHVYHVQTEDGGIDNPAFESLVYIGGTIVAKKRTAYTEQLSSGATEDVIASLLKRQHQTMIAAIKAGRIEDLIRHSAKQQTGKTQLLGSLPPAAAGMVNPVSSHDQSEPAGREQTSIAPESGAGDPNKPVRVLAPKQKPAPQPADAHGAGFDLDQVVSEYLTRNAEAQKIDLKVLSPDVFTAGKSVGLRVQVSCGGKAETDAVVTIKVIGTAFKPQVYIGRSSVDGVASFSLAIPAFSAGTAAIVIEGQSKRGRGELKQLIRRS